MNPNPEIVRIQALQIGDCYSTLQEDFNIHTLRLVVDKAKYHLDWVYLASGKTKGWELIGWEDHMGNVTMYNDQVALYTKADADWANTLRDQAERCDASSSNSRS